MSQNGFRQRPQLSKNESVKELETKLANVEMAMRMNQMLVQQLLTQVQRLDRDMHNTIAVTNDLEYRTRAILNTAAIDTAKVDSEADALKLIDYNSASDKEDQEKGYTVAEEVGPESIVIISSETESGENAIFRSKFKLSDSGLPQLVSGLQGKKVGETAKIDINGQEHTVTVHGVREVPVKQETAKEAE